MENPQKQLPATTEQQPKPKTAEQIEEEKSTRRTMIIIGVVAALAIIALIIFFIWLLFGASQGTTTKIRDVFIIFMALESLFIGLVLGLLVIQLARLTNLLQNEIKPILESTSETVNTLRGTTVFLSDNLVEPVIKLNEYMAALQQMLTIIGLVRKPKTAKQQSKNSQ